MKSLEFRAPRRAALLIVLAALPALCVLLALAWTAAPALLDARDLDAMLIYAYRDWQSTGVYVNQDHVVTIRARGMWLYTPGEWNNPNGHPRYAAPYFYPVPGIRGGALIARIGENGAPFFAGSNLQIRSVTDGMLYLRIDDDVLTDNEGYLEASVQVAE